MSLIGTIQTFFSDPEKTKPVFPRTKIKAISDDNGIGLDAILEEVKSVATQIDSKFAGCWISFTDENDNPTTEPYIHWNE